MQEQTAIRVRIDSILTRLEAMQSVTKQFDKLRHEKNAIEAVLSQLRHAHGCAILFPLNFFPWHPLIYLISMCMHFSVCSFYEAISLRPPFVCNLALRPINPLPLSPSHSLCLPLNPSVSLSLFSSPPTFSRLMTRIIDDETDMDILCNSLHLSMAIGEVEQCIPMILYGLIEEARGVCCVCVCVRERRARLKLYHIVFYAGIDRDALELLLESQTNRMLG